MNLFELFVKIGVDDQASGAISKIASGLGNGLKTAAAAGVAAVGAASAGIAALTKSAIENYAEYEQLIGGVKTLFKDSADAIQGYAENAYRTAGLSANEYMETVTSFSASLLQSLGNDTEEAARYADMAITDMADNANKMGTSMESIQNAYQGFAKQNYTMLDNLKLGYGGTKEEMERLLSDAEKLPRALGKKFDISNYADVVEAIHLVQEEMGIADAAADEAASTISGSVATMKAAWSNLVTGIADENSDFETLINNFVESAGTAFKQISPRIETALSGIANLIDRLFPVIAEKIPQIIADILPSIATSAAKIVENLISGIKNNQRQLTVAALDVITTLVNSFLGMLPEIISLGLELIISLANGIAENVDELVPTIVDVVLKIVDTITDPDTLSNLIDAAIAITIALANGLIDALPRLLEKVPEIINNLVDAIIDNAPKLIESAISLIVTLVEGIIDCLPMIFEVGFEILNELGNGVRETLELIYNKGPEIINSLIEGIKSMFSKLLDIGGEVVSTIKTGISNSWSGVTSWFDGLWDSAFGNREVDVTVNKGFSGGGRTNVDGRLASGLEYVPFDGYIAELHEGERVLTRQEAIRYNEREEDAPINITIQSVLDGRMLGENMYQFIRSKDRAYGGSI